MLWMLRVDCRYWNVSLLHTRPRQTGLPHLKLNIISFLHYLCAFIRLFWNTPRRLSIWVKQSVIQFVNGYDTKRQCQETNSWSWEFLKSGKSVFLRCFTIFRTVLQDIFREGLFFGHSLKKSIFWRILVILADVPLKYTGSDSINILLIKYLINSKIDSFYVSIYICIFTMFCICLRIHSQGRVLSPILFRRHQNCMVRRWLYIAGVRKWNWWHIWQT